MLETLLIYALICLVLNFILLLLVALKFRFIGRVSVLIWIMVINAIGAFGIRNLANTSMPLTLCSVVLGSAQSALATKMFRDWNPPGQMFFGSLLASEFLYVLYKINIILSLRLNALGLCFSLLLTSFEIFTLITITNAIRDTLEASCRVRWREKPRSSGNPRREYCPKVSLHVPIRDEPVVLVKETLNSLSELNYPNYEIIVIDGSTVESLWRPIETYCKQRGFTFYHLENHPGYKAGALNFALRKTSKDAEIVGIIDADYIVKSDYLSKNVLYFSNPQIAFVQTFSDCRNQPESWMMQKVYNFYRYFFDIAMVSRNQRNSIIFAGTMGLIRRRALEEIGGWAEWCITEDAEVSLRILSLGYDAIYVNHSYGRGLMPQTLVDCRRQWFRWVFGHAQILRRHLWSILLSRSNRVKLTLAQRWDYLISNVAPIGSMLMILSNAFLVPALALVLGSSVVRYETPLLNVLSKLAPPMAIFAGFLLLSALVCIVLAFKVRMQCSWKASFVAFSTMLSFTCVFAFACWQGMSKRRGVFHRTPKFQTQTTRAQSLRAVRLEMALASVLVLLNVLLVYSSAIYNVPPGLIFLSAWHLFAYLSAVALAVQSPRYQKSQ